MWKSIAGIFDRVLVVSGVIVFAQAPLFIHQYTQQLSGHTQELRYQVRLVQDAAQTSQKTLSAYIDKFLQSADADFKAQGVFLEQMVQRWNFFEQALTALENASILSKPFVFLANIDHDVASVTWEKFEFGLSFSWEGIVYACIGGFIGFFICKIFFRLVSRVRNWILRSHKKTERS